MYVLPYKILKKRLGELTAVKKVDWFTNNKNSKGSIKTSPAAFIKFAPWDPATYSDGSRRGVLDFSIIVYSEDLREAGQRVDTQFGTNHYDLVNDIRLHLEGFAAVKSFITEFADLAETEDDYTIFNTVEFLDIGEDHNADKLMETELKFNVFCIDNSGKKQYTHVSKNLTINNL